MRIINKEIKLQEELTYRIKNKLNILVEARKFSIQDIRLNR